MPDISCWNWLLWLKIVPLSHISQTSISRNSWPDLVVRAPNPNNLESWGRRITNSKPIGLQSKVKTTLVNLVRPVSKYKKYKDWGSSPEAECLPRACKILLKAFQLGWLAREPSGSCLYLPTLGLQACIVKLDYLHGCWGFELKIPCLHTKHSYPLSHHLAPLSRLSMLGRGGEEGGCTTVDVGVHPWGSSRLFSDFIAGKTDINIPVTTMFISPIDAPEYKLCVSWQLHSSALKNWGSFLEWPHHFPFLQEDPERRSSPGSYSLECTPLFRPAAVIGVEGYTWCFPLCSLMAAEARPRIPLALLCT